MGEVRGFKRVRNGKTEYVKPHSRKTTGAKLVDFRKRRFLWGIADDLRKNWRLRYDKERKGYVDEDGKDVDIESVKNLIWDKPKPKRKRKRRKAYVGPDGEIYYS